MKPAIVLLAIAAANAQTGLRTPLEHFAAIDKPFADALRDLAIQARYGVVLGFEQAVIASGSQPPLVDAVIDKGTVGDALTALCYDGRYTFAEVQPGLVEVRPANEPPQLKALLDLPVASFDLDIQDWFRNLFLHVPDLIRELRSYLNEKVLEWSRQTGQPPPGSVGSILGGGVPPPRVELHVAHTTVRGVLDALALYTAAHAAPKERLGMVGETGQPPSGWSVEFTPDPQAHTGLGGYVKWSPFP